MREALETTSSGGSFGLATGLEPVPYRIRRSPERWIVHLGVNLSANDWPPRLSLIKPTPPRRFYYFVVRSSINFHVVRADPGVTATPPTH